MQSDLLNIGDVSAQVIEIWARTYSAILSVGVNPDAPNAKTPGASVSEVNVRVIAALAATASLRGVDPSKLELLAHRLPAVKTALDGIAANTNQIIAVLEPLAGATSTDQNGNLQLQIQSPEKPAVSFDLGSPLSTVIQHCNVLLENLPYISRVIGEKEFPVFAGLVKAGSQHVEKARDSAQKAEMELSNGTASVKELKELSSTATNLTTQLQELLTASIAQKTLSDSNAAELEQKLARVREVAKDADTLQQRVTGFTSQFEAFESQMKTRLEQFSKFEVSTQEAQRINEERDKKILELIEKADTMIRGATTAGLSKSLDEAKDLYEARLQKTQKYFLFSAIALFVCTLPLAAQFVPGPWQQYFTHVESGDAGQITPWLGTIGKIIFLIPATWATAFFANNYAELFHLSREYAHKAALAKAIDGFKREAPEYAQEIVSSVFMEIQDNPGSRKAPAAATPQNPVTEKFFEKVLDAIKALRGSK